MSSKNKKRQRQHGGAKPGNKRIARPVAAPPQAMRRAPVAPSSMMSTGDPELDEMLNTALAAGPEGQEDPALKLLIKTWQPKSAEWGVTNGQIGALRKAVGEAEKKLDEIGGGIKVIEKMVVERLLELRDESDNGDGDDDDGDSDAKDDETDDQDGETDGQTEAADGDPLEEGSEGSQSIGKDAEPEPSAAEQVLEDEAAECADAEPLSEQVEKACQCGKGTDTDGDGHCPACAPTPEPKGRPEPVGTRVG